MNIGRFVCLFLIFGAGFVGVCLTVLMFVLLCSTSELPPFEHPATIAELRACEGKPVQMRIRLCTDEELSIPELGAKANALYLSSFVRDRGGRMGLPQHAERHASLLRCTDDAGSGSMPVLLSPHVEMESVPLTPEMLNMPAPLTGMLRHLPNDGTFVLAERYQNAAVPTDENLHTGDVEIQVLYTPSGTPFWVRGKVRDGVLVIDSNGWACLRRDKEKLPRQYSRRGMHVVQTLACFGTVAAPFCLMFGLLVLRLGDCRCINDMPYWQTLAYGILGCVGVSLSFWMFLMPEFRYPETVRWGLMSIGIFCVCLSASQLLRLARQARGNPLLWR